MVEPLSTVASIEQYISTKMQKDTMKTGKEESVAPNINTYLNGKRLFPWESLVQVTYY